MERQCSRNASNNFFPVVCLFLPRFCDFLSARLEKNLARLIFQRLSGIVAKISKKNNVLKMMPGHKVILWPRTVSRFTRPPLRCWRLTHTGAFVRGMRGRPRGYAAGGSGRGFRGGRPRTERVLRGVHHHGEQGADGARPPPGRPLRREFFPVTQTREFDTDDIATPLSFVGGFG